MADTAIELISIGDELLIGHTLDTNAFWIANQLTDLGCPLRWHSTVGDDPVEIEDAVKRSLNRADFVILTGGLGPTEDDLTRVVLAQIFDDELVHKSDLMERIRRRFADRGLKPPPGYEALADFPSKAVPIANEHGSAPGIHYHWGAGCELFALPGVPVEMRGMMLGYVLDRIRSSQHGAYQYRIFRTAGIGESHLAQLIGRSEKYLPVRIAYLPSVERGVTIRLAMAGASEDEVKAKLDTMAEVVESKIREHVYAVGDKTLEEMIISTLRRRGERLAVAESCTGGMICDRFVAVPGCSDVFERGFISYSNRAKIELLGVSDSLLEAHGAVSSEAASAMAEGARVTAGVEWGVGVTGIAGPSGGSIEKPVGLTYIAAASPESTDCMRFLFGGDRMSNRQRSALAALTMLWKRLQGLE